MEDYLPSEDSHEIVIFDFDKVLYFSKSSSALEDFLKNHPSKKAKLFYPAVVGYVLFTKSVQKITGFKTGESTVLAALDIILNKHPLSKEYITDYGKELSENIPRDIIDLINKIPTRKFIVTSEPKDLVEVLVKYSGLKMDGIYGNEFNIRDGFIYGFKHYNLDAGMSAKYFRTKLLLYDLLTKGYPVSKIYAIGDSISDKGINGEIGIPVERYEVHCISDVISSITKISDVINTNLSNKHDIFYSDVMF